VGLVSRVCIRARGDGSGLLWGLGWAGASGLCAPPAVRGLLSGALKGRCTPAQGTALGTRVSLPHSTPKRCGSRTSHTALRRTPSGCSRWGQAPLRKAATPLGLGRWVGRATQGSGANAATLGSITLPRWGIGDRAYDGPQAGPLTRGRVRPAVGTWLGGGVRLVCPAGCAGPAVRSPERALYTSPGQVDNGMQVVAGRV
jgi:hypothetical protein